MKKATGLTLSVGVGSNKSIAKIASDLEKPDGLVVVPRGTEAAFLAPMPVRALWGVGPKTEAVLTRAGIRTIGDLARRSAADAQRLLGSSGEFLHDMANGIDDREVTIEHERKSVGAERTFARDLPDGPDLRAALADIAAEVARRLAHSHVKAHTVAIKLRYANFHTITRQASVKTPTDDAAGDHRAWPRNSSTTWSRRATSSACSASSARVSPRPPNSRNSGAAGQPAVDLPTGGASAC